MLRRLAVQFFVEAARRGRCRQVIVLLTVGARTLSTPLEFTDVIVKYHFAGERFPMT